MSAQEKEKLLLHACCAPCITHPVKLLAAAFQVSALFYNPNIHPEDEYQRRKEEIACLMHDWRIPLVVGPYDTDRWFEQVKGFEDEPEGGVRCGICFRMRLVQTAKTAKSEGFDVFATTLSISPHKDVRVINRMGKDVAGEYGVRFLASDFKKKDGFKIACCLSEEEGLYRQNYCGCQFSRREKSQGAS